MKKQVLALLILLLSPSFLLAQQSADAPSKVVKAAYFDKTPPLSQMKVILPGERDRSWKDDIIQNESLEENFDKASHPDDTLSLKAQQAFGTYQTRGPVNNFDGVGNVNGVFPPDTDGDVGPDHYFQMINLSFAIFDKMGNLLYGPVDNSTLWDGFIGPWTGSNDGDPIVLYDEEADRWVASQFAVNLSNGKSYELVAVSATPDPLGSYYRYAFEFDAMNDYPKLGIWHDGYYASYHMFSGNFMGAAFTVFDRDAMIAGDSTAVMIYFGEYPSIFGILPADFDGTPPPSDAPAYFMDMSFQKNIEIYELDVDWDNPMNSTFTNTVSLTPAAYNTNLNGIPQPNTSVKLDDLAGMLMFPLQYRNFGSYETMVANHTVRYSGRAAIRWYELRKETGDWYIYQQGTYSPNSQHRWMGSIAMNASGEIALGYSVSDADSTYPSIRYTGRSPDAPLGEMNYDEVEVRKGLSSQTNLNRWGDYSFMAVDPSDDSTFWYTQEYRKKNNWGTWITSFDFGPAQMPVVAISGNDTICAFNFAAFTADVLYQQSIEWTTSGDGFFSSANNLSTNYAHGSEDLANGSATIYATAYGFAPDLVATDSVQLIINNTPQADAGPDTLICTDDYAMLQGFATNYSKIEWSTNGDGSFESDTLLHTNYYPGSGDVANGNVQLKLTAYPLPPCNDVDSDNIMINIDECTGLSEHNQVNFTIKIIPNPVGGLFSYRIDGLTPGRTTISILDINGQLLFKNQFNAQADRIENKIDMSGFNKGTYIFRIEQPDHMQNVKFILE